MKKIILFLMPMFVIFGILWSFKDENFIFSEFLAVLSRIRFNDTITELTSIKDDLFSITKIFSVWKGGDILATLKAIVGYFSNISSAFTSSLMLPVRLISDLITNIRQITDYLFNFGSAILSPIRA